MSHCPNYIQFWERTEVQYIATVERASVYHLYPSNAAPNRATKTDHVHHIYISISVSLL